jgi:hypothetical protein
MYDFSLSAATGPRNGATIQGRDKRSFSLHHSVWIGPVVHLARYLMVPRSVSLDANRPDHEADCTLPSITEVKNARTDTSALPCFTQSGD